MKQNDARKIDTHLDCQLDGKTTSSKADDRESWEKEQYACYYNYLFSLIQDERLDYAKVAKRSGLKEHRIEEVLTFRLKPARQNMQLFGYREGSCYVCSVKTHAGDPVEPVCLKCLQMIEVACLGIEEDAALLAQTSTLQDSVLTPSLEAPQGAMETLHSLPEAPPTATGEEAPGFGETVPVTLLWSVQAELERYKKHFGELPLEAPGMSQEAPPVLSPLIARKEESAEAANASDEPCSQTIDPAQEVVNETEKLLRILSVNDQELACEAAELTDLLKTILPNNNAPLRHFGFLRSKAYKVQ